MKYMNKQTKNLFLHILSNKRNAFDIVSLYILIIIDENNYICTEHKHYLYIILLAICL